MMSKDESTGILILDWLDAQPAGARLAANRTLTPLLDKPALQLAVEQLVAMGVRQIHAFLGDDATPSREFLGNGERWGIRIQHHYWQEAEDLASNLRVLSLEAQRMYWLSCPERLPSPRLTPPSVDDGAYGLHWSVCGSDRRRRLGDLVLAGCGDSPLGWRVVENRQDRRFFQQRLAADVVAHAQRGAVLPQASWLADGTAGVGH